MFFVGGVGDVVGEAVEEVAEGLLRDKVEVAEAKGLGRRTRVNGILGVCKGSNE
jgi:hypothetical protein